MNEELPCKLSVVTVTWNDLDRLKRTCASVEGQVVDFRFEHLIIDANSTDGSIKWGREWQASDQGRKFISEPDDGIFDGMNKGISYTQGDYVVFLNAGDTLADSGSLQRYVDGVSPRGAKWGFGAARIVDRDGFPVRPPVGGKRYSQFGHRYGFAKVCHQAVIMEVDFLKELGGFEFQQYGFASDYALLIRAGMASRPNCWDSTEVNYEAGGISETDVYRQLWRRSRARRRVIHKSAISKSADFVWTILQTARVFAGHVARVALPAVGVSRAMGRDIVKLNAQHSGSSSQP